jgi:hypothetical protein
MPLYVYQAIEADGSEGEVFEVLQAMSDPPLTHHPETGKRVQRLLSLPNAGRGQGDLTSSKLERHGFTQYTRTDRGTYEKTAGQGPTVISGE